MITDIAHFEKAKLAHSVYKKSHNLFLYPALCLRKKRLRVFKTISSDIMRHAMRCYSMKTCHVCFCILVNMPHFCYVVGILATVDEYFDVFDDVFDETES